jgi:hypothetical protein
LLKQIVERTFRGLAQAAVHGRDLKYRASRRDEPVEPLSLGEVGDRARVRVTFANALNSLQPFADQSAIDLAAEGSHTCLVNVNTSSEKPVGHTKQQHTGVNKLLTLDPRHDPQDGVVKRV